MIYLDFKSFPFKKIKSGTKFELSSEEIYLKVRKLQMFLTLTFRQLRNPSIYLITRIPR